MQIKGKFPNEKDKMTNYIKSLNLFPKNKALQRSRVLKRSSKINLAGSKDSAGFQEMSLIEGSKMPIIDLKRHTHAPFNIDKDVII